MTFVAWISVLSAGVWVVGRGTLDANLAYQNFRLRIGEIEEKREQFGQVNERYNALKEKISAVEGAFASDQQRVLSIVGLLEDEARRAGISSSVASIAEDRAPAQQSRTRGDTQPKASAVLPGIIFRVEASGGLVNISRFVKAVQAFPYFLQVQKLSITNPSFTGAPLALNATLLLKIYTLP